MLVGERMSHPVITVNPKMPITEALNLLRTEHIRRAPVIKDGKMVGIISEKDLLNAAPSSASSLSVWEVNYLISKVTVAEVMSKKVFSVSEDTPIEEAARVMADNKIGGLPVTRDDEVVGMITETNLFKVFLELMGAREPGVRVTATIPEQRGQLARLTQAIAEAGGNFIAFGQFAGVSPNTRLLTFKVEGLDQEALKKLISPHVLEVKDIRTV
ncbi:MAG: CBS domain-containing protein [Anaerolineales bacterium]|nr:CBS domain-containing protein [Anaerolineales bacterium]